MDKKFSHYRDAGVDIDAGNRFVERIKPLAATTHRPEVLTGLGGFASLFQLQNRQYHQPVLVSGTDGVGTKLKLAISENRLEVVGVDLVAMCANDVAVTGAEPLFFLDYFATGQLQVSAAERVISGIATGCRKAGCALVGGETAELPGFYQKNDFDLAGFCVGVVERSKLITGNNVKPGDVVLGIASGGVHANGFSLVNRTLKQASSPLDSQLNGKTVRDWLLAPTLIYVEAIRKLVQHTQVNGIAHITGGGIIENLPRILPPHLSARLDSSQWPQPPIFTWLSETGGIPRDEMYRVFNMGLGLIVVLPKGEIGTAVKTIMDCGLDCWPVGSIEEGLPRIRID